MGEEVILDIIQAHRSDTIWSLNELVIDDLIITSNRILVIRKQTGSGSMYIPGLSWANMLVGYAINLTIQSIQSAQKDALNRLILSSNKVEELLNVCTN